MAFSLQEALENIRSDKIKDRQQGLEALEHIFSDPDNVLNLDPKQDGKAWLKVYQSLFACVLAEKAACIRKGSFSDAQPVALARLQRAAQMLRSLVEKTASFLTRKVVKALLTHILQMLNHRGTLLRPIAPAYTSALCAILKHQHHVDHLEPEDWWAAASLCFDILLGRDLDRPTGASASGSDQWLASIPTAVPNIQRRGLSLEDAVMAECLRHLMASTVAPLLGPEGHALELLADYTRFLLAFSAESSAHLPALTGLVVLLEHLELNYTREVIFATLALRHVILSLWKTKNHLLKMQLVLALRIVVPLIASCATDRYEVALSQSSDSSSSLQMQCIPFLELIHEAFLRDPDTRWALDAVRIEALVFRWPQHKQAEPSYPDTALCNSAFSVGPFSREQDSLAWCRVTLQVDLVDALTTLDALRQENGASKLSNRRDPAQDELPNGTAASEVSVTRSHSSNGKRGPGSVNSSPQKRRRTGLADPVKDDSEHSCLSQLSGVISNTDSSVSAGASTRLCALQLLTFAVLSRPQLLNVDTLVEIDKVLLSLLAETDTQLVSWSMIALGAIVLMHSTAEADARQDNLGSLVTKAGAHAWGVATRKLQLPETCRAAAFLLSAMLASDCLTETVLHQEVSRMLAEVDLQGPPVMCDSVCHLMTLLLERTTSNRTYQHLDPRRKIGAWFSNIYSPAQPFQSTSATAGARSTILFVPYQDLLRLLSSVFVEGEAGYPVSAFSCGNARTDAVAELLCRRVQLQPLRDLALTSRVVEPQFTNRIALHHAAVAQSGPALFSSETFHRMVVIIEKKIDACLDAVEALAANDGSSGSISCHAAVSAIQAAILAIEVLSHPLPQGSLNRAAKLQQCCQIIIKILDIAALSKSIRPEEFGIIVQQLDLLAPCIALRTRGDATLNDLLRRPTVASGVTAYASDTPNVQSQATEAATDAAIKRWWTAIRDADMLEAMLSCCDRLLERALFGEQELGGEPASAVTSSARDAFDDMPESGSSSSIRTLASASRSPTESIEAVINVAVRLLSGVPRILSGTADSRRDESIVSLFFDCPLEGIVSLSPVLFDSVLDGTLWMSQRDLVDALDRIGAELLTSYRFARQPSARLAAVRAVSAVAPLLLEDCDEQSDLFDKVQKLAIFFADQIGRTKWPTPWEVQIACATFLAECLRSDSEGRLCRSGSARGTSFSPMAALLQINADPDIRVRGLGSAIATSIFDTAVTDEAQMSELYTTFRDGLPSDSSIPQHILTRALSLSNVAIANSAVRRSALFHLLEIVLATDMFPVTVQQLFADVAARLGFMDASKCYQAFAAQITWGMATNGYDPLQIPWKVLGFSSKRECLESTFASCGSMLLAAQTPEGRTQFDALVQLTRRTHQQGLQECLPFLTAAYLGFAIQAGQQEGQPDLPDIAKQTLTELSLLGFAESENDQTLRKMITNADDLIVTALLSLYYEIGETPEASRHAAIAALIRQDAKGGEILTALTPSTDMPKADLHEPSRPFFPAAVICAAFSALTSLELDPFRKDVVYNVLRHIFHSIASSRFVNDQLRLCAALRIYIALCGDAFWSDQLNAHLLIKSIELLLDQPHLRDDFRPFLVYACSRSCLAQKSPEILVSCIVTWSVALGDQLDNSEEEGAWLLEAAREVAKTSPAATSATVLLWPVKVTSTEQAAIESLVDIDTLSFAIHACSRITLRLPSLLRIRTVLRKANKKALEAFCRDSAWKLLERMTEGRPAPSIRSGGDSQSDVMSDIFAIMMTVGEAGLLQRAERRIGGQSEKTMSETFLEAVDTSQISSLLAATVLIICQLMQELPLEQSHRAFGALRSVSSTVQVPLTEMHPTKMPASAREELSRVRQGISPPPSAGAAPSPQDLLEQELLQAAASSDRWICRISAVLCDLLTQHQAVFRSINPFVAKDTAAAKALLPVLLLCFTATDIEPSSAAPAAPTVGSKRRTSSRKSDLQVQSPSPSITSCRSAVAAHFEQVLSADSSDPVCGEIIIQALLTLRAFRPVQAEPDKVCFWYDVDRGLLAKRCIACGLFSAAIFFVEHSVLEDETQTPSASVARTRTNLLHQAYSNIDDPDAFYGITEGDVRELLVKRLHHEGQWLRAFQYHAADYEASTSDTKITASASAQLLGQSLSHLGFQHVSEGLTSVSASQDGLDAGVFNRNASSWDLPGSPSASLSQPLGVATVLQTLRQATSEQDVDGPLSVAFQSQLRLLCSMPVESIHAMRRVQGDLLALGQIKDWRKASASLGPEEAVAHLRAVWTRVDAANRFEVTENLLNTRHSVLQAARQRLQSSQIGDVLDGPAEQVAKVERSVLVLLSQQAREHEKLQQAINATARADRIEGALSDDARIAREEFAAVLWDQNEHSSAMQLLSQIVEGLGPLTTQSPLPQKRRGARLMALLAQWRATARSQHPREIDRELFVPALTLTAPATASNGIADASAAPEQSEVAYRWARFAEDHHRGSDVAEISRLRLYIDRRREEIAQNQRECEKTSSKTDRSKLLLFQRQAEKILRQDQTRLSELEASRTHFLRRSVAMYARALASSDTYDDAMARLISLWFENAADAELNRLLAQCLPSVPSRKLIPLMHQLSARLTEVPNENDIMAPFQSNLSNLLMRMCQDHPFHCLYAIFALIKTGADAKAAAHRPSPRSSLAPSDTSSVSVSPQILRSTAAEKIWNHIKRRSSLAKRIRTVEELCLAYVEWAEYDLTTRPDRYFQSSGAIKKGALRMPPSGELRLARMRDLAVPVATAHLETDPTCRYETFVSIARYSDTFTTAGGIHLPKISECIGSDGKRYKQLFKRDDDLRQDAVMQQVFRMVNELLHADRRTRERRLAIRTYTVLPLGPQCGMLEFVVNTVPLGEVLIALHAKYCPNDLTPTQARGKMRDAQSLPAEAKLEAFLDVCEGMRPAFRYFFSDAQRMPRNWYETRLRYTRSVSTNSIVGHVLGLGDRHVSNILLDKESGELVHIDFGVAFDQGKLLPIPELVPFRLTRDLVDGMGINGVEGTFRRCCEETLRVLRAHQDVIKTVLEVFRHDPLFAWTSNPIKVLRAQEDEDSIVPAPSMERSGSARSTPAPTPTPAAAARARSITPLGAPGEPASVVGTDTAELSADRAVTSVMSKLSSSLSIEYTVNDLIQQAMDARNLAAIFHGWQAAL